MFTSLILLYLAGAQVSMCLASCAGGVTMMLFGTLHMLVTGWIIFMTVTNSDAALHMIPSFEEYDNGTEFLSFACLESDYSEISLEWLDPNGNVMIPTTETARIDVDGSFITFEPPMKSDAGSYWCRSKTNHNNMAEGKLMYKGPPELLSEQTQTVIVPRGEQVVLNCTVSSSPDPAYNWSFPDTCSSCPLINNDSVMIFTADITDSGEYVCEAGNKYGSVYHSFNVKVLSKPSPITRNTTTIIKDCNKDNSNVVLTCGIYYPSAVVKWNIMMDSSTTHHSVEESSTGKYIVHNNGSLEVHHRYVSDNDHLIFMCSADNMNGSIEQVFHVWDHNAFYQGTSPMIYRDLNIRSHRVIVQAACVGQSSWQHGSVRFKVRGGRKSY
ncbi:contactin-5-like isoform X2 [Dysidea avara]|uniref:contactin-5-like isoform X2 n=1 Tax=Dysidea avara TaxID=196820 RepID=UPI00331924CD